MKRILGAWILCAFLLVAHLFGQASDGNIMGAALDTSGAAIPNATITLENLRTGIQFSTKTDATGLYRFGNVVVGRYRVTASAPGFTTTSLNDVALELNKTATANIAMQVGGVSTAIDVLEAPTIIDTTTGQISNNYGSRMAAELPAPPTMPEEC